MKKATILIYKDTTAPKKGLREATQEEWSAILRANKGLPMCQRRCFIEDAFEDCGVIDRMFIEVPYEEYCRWNRENTLSYRNRKAVGASGILSLDVPAKESDGGALKDILPANFNLEEKVVNELMMTSLRNSLRKWKPWACDMLDFYLVDNTRLCSSALIEKYSVTYTTVAKWKKLFEEYVKNFYERG